MDIIWNNTIEGKPKPQLRANRFCSNSNSFLTPLSIKIRLCNCANLYQTNSNKMLHDATPTLKNSIKYLTFINRCKMIN